MRNIKKRNAILLIVLSLIIVVSIITGILGYRNATFFSKSLLKDHLIPNLPRATGKFIKKDERYVCFHTSKEEFEMYVKEVYKYLLSCDFSHLGYQGKETNKSNFPLTGYRPPIYESYPGVALSDYYIQPDDYVFVYANAPQSEGELVYVHYLEIGYNAESGYMGIMLCRDDIAQYIVRWEEQ